MDGGRGGGGRGKGKKAKAAKKKAAAAAAAAQSQAQAAQVAHKKPHHSGKKVGATHAGVQVVAVSKAAASTEARAASGGPHDQSMTKSKAKRMRLKKAAAHALVMKQTALDTDKQHKKSPTAGAGAASPKMKNVAVLTPPPAAAGAKPHVVSLTGGKKKRKRNALVAEENEAAAASTGLQREEKKTVAVVGHSSVVLPAVATKGKSLKPTTTSPKRKIAQLGSAAQEQRAQKESGVALTTASPKSVVVASPRKIVKKMKAKAEAPVGIKAAAAATKREAQVAAKNLPAKDPATTDGENQVVAKKLQAKKAVPQEQKPAVEVMSRLTEPVKAETATLTRTIAKVDTSVKQSSANQQSPESSGQVNKIPPKTSFENESVDTSHKAAKRGITQAAAMIPCTTATGDKPAVPKPAPFREIAPAVSPEPAHDDSTGTTSTAARVARNKSEPQGSVPKEAKTDRLSSRSRKVDIIMDSHSYVQKMMHAEMAKTGDSRGRLSAKPTMALPSRPRNAWGASFGLVPPSTVVTSAPRTLSTTPLSSWFLSKGCANFVKKVHFSDDDDDNNGSSDDDDIPTLPRGMEKASPKRRASFVKKNAFLESLKTQSNWRSWYGNVDMLNLLDPPLAYIPEKLQMHNVTPLQLPEATEIRATGKRANDLEMLERDIRREKQRGSAFGEQLLMMLQGKTVSGKPLEEEYNTILH